MNLKEARPPVSAAPAAGPMSRGAMASPMPGPGAGAADSPPFILPGEHFAAGLLFWLAGALGLVVYAPALAQGLYPLPPVVSTTHLFTLGWITTSIMGALYQFLPVALGVPIRSRKLAHATWALYVPGLVLFLAGVLRNDGALRTPGAALFGTALLLFVLNLSLTLHCSKTRDLTWWSLAGAALFLTSTVLIGAALAANLDNGMLGGSRAMVTGVHLHIAIFGWVLLVMIGVARHLLPMFLLSHGASLRFSWWALFGVGGGALALLTLHHAPLVVARVPAALLIAVGVSAFLVQAAQFYRHRKRPQLDAGMRLAAAGLVLFALGVLQGPFALLGGAGHARLWTGYIAALLLGISLFVAAHYYKIVPFLVWYHRYGPLAGTRPLPRVAELYSARIATAAAALLALGAFGMVAGIAVGNGHVVRAFASSYALGALLEFGQMVRLSTRRPQ